MKMLNIPKGTPVLICAPAKPMPQSQSLAIGDMVGMISGVREAYLPHCFAQGIMQNPCQVLVLALDPAANRQKVTEATGEGLAQILPPGTQLDIWLINDGDDVLSAIRTTRTHIHCSPPPPKKPWWRIFG